MISKTITVLTLLILVGCQSPDSADLASAIDFKIATENHNSVYGFDENDDLFLLMSAEKEYSPIKTDNALTSIPYQTPTKMVIPESIAVTSGSPGNYYAIVYFAGAGAFCLYQGNVASGDVIAQEDRKYLFQYCYSDGEVQDTVPGDIIEENLQISFRIVDGEIGDKVVAKLYLYIDID